MEENWETIRRPAQFGKKRDAIFKLFDDRYGKGNWRLVWQIGEATVDFLGACAVYEDAYFYFFERNPGMLAKLIDVACDVYDDAETNVQSRFDYLKQETSSTHLQDIAIRRSLIRMGLWFRGKELIQVRMKSQHPRGAVLSPGVVTFHRPDWIRQPELTGWWQPGSIEAFYQSNKLLQVKAGSL